MAKAEDFARLTERHKQCLRLVARLYQTKNISAELGIAPRRIDKIIAEAMLILGSNQRAAAARILAEHEAKIFNAGGGDIFTGQPFPLTKPVISCSDEPVVESPGTQWDASESLGATQTPPRASEPLALSIPLPFPTNGRSRNDLKGMSLLTAVAIIAAASLLAAGAAVSLLFAFNHWVHG